MQPVHAHPAPYPYPPRYNPYAHNPWTRGQKIAAVLGGVAVLGIGTWLLWPRQAQAAAPTPTPPQPQPTPTPTPTPTPDTPGLGIPSNAIGGGYDWQPRSQWPSYGAVVGGLQAFGYAVPPDYGQRADDPRLMVDVRNTVRQFQRDYGHAVNFLSQFPQTGSGGTADGTAAPRQSLGVDGWIGPQTWPAFKWAYAQITKFPNYQGNVWRDWIEGGKQV